MTERRSASGRVRFGIFELDPATGELRRDGAFVRLQPQPTQVLAYLVDHAGEVVTREALREAVWGRDTFVDFDRGVNFCIAQIRAALADTADSPRFIRTLPKRGYQFIAPVDRAAVLDVLDAGHVGAAPAARVESRPAGALADSRSARRLGIAVLVVAVTAAGFAGGRWWSRAASGRSTRIAVARFDNETANPDFDRFSDALTDTVVAQLTATAEGRYEVIGNADILRGPRAQRDLRAIGASLGASYVILGQVQQSGGRIRVLAHLIRLPEQTHLWVTRLDRSADDPLALQLEIARIIASDVSRRLSSDAPAQQPSSKAAND